MEFLKFCFITLYKSRLVKRKLKPKFQHLSKFYTEGSARCLDTIMYTNLSCMK